MIRPAKIDRTSGIFRSMTFRTRALRLAAVLSLGAGLLSVAPATAGADLQTGIDGLPAASTTQLNPWAADQWVPLITGTGAEISRHPVFWSSVAPTRPANESNPDDPAYRWASLDAEIRRSQIAGLQPFLHVYRAPAWAEGPGRPTTGYGPCAAGQQAGKTPPCAGTWKPDSGALRRFATALASRYDGNTPDPRAPNRTLPQVKMFEPWNEPNYKSFLTPQCSVGTLKSDGTCTSGGQISAISLYRTLLNAFYDGVTAAYGGNKPSDVKVVAGALGPYGSTAQGPEIEPQRFARVLMCLGGTAANPTMLAASSCPVKAKLDALSFHPYTLLDEPTTTSKTADGTALGDSPELRKALDFAISKKTILPAGSKPLWVTEVGWFTCPPCDALNRGVAQPTAAAWTAEMLYRLWSWKVDMAVWYGLLDGPRRSPTSSQSSWPAGLYSWSSTASGARAKPIVAAFRFPIYSLKTSKTKAFSWTMTPCKIPGATVTFRTKNLSTGRFTIVSTVTLPQGTDGTVKTPAWTIPSGTRLDVRAAVEGPGCKTETSAALPIDSP